MVNLASKLVMFEESSWWPSGLSIGLSTCGMGSIPACDHLFFFFIFVCHEFVRFYIAFSKVTSGGSLRNS